LLKKSNIVSLAEKLVKASKKKVDSAEFYLQFGEGKSFSIKNNSLNFASGGDEFGIGIRVIHKGKKGFCYTDLKNAEKGIDLAKRISALSPKREYSFVGKKRYPRIKGMVDKRIIDLQPEDALEHVHLMIDTARDYKRGMKVTSGAMGWSHGMDVVASTEGVLVSNEGTSIGGYISCVYPSRTGTVATGSWHDSLRHIKLDFKKVGEEAARIAFDSRSPKPLRKGGEMTVVFEPEALCEMLEFTVIPSLYGMNINRGESVYSNRIGELVAHKGLSITDDPLDPKGDISGICDDEGVPTQKTPLIEKGKLMGALYDTSSACKYDAKPTGNGIRTQKLAGEQSFRFQPTTTARNMVMKGRGAVKDMDTVISKVDRGIYVMDVLGGHTANPTSSDFSVMTSVLWEIRKGRLGKPLRSVMMSGNAARSLENIVAIGRDHRYLGGSLSTIGVCFPTLAVDGITVTP
jgi:PmbA protein